MRYIIFCLLVSVVTISCRQNKEIVALQKSAEQGNVEAQFKLGMYFLSGEKVNKSYQKAAYWFRKAAE